MYNKPNIYEINFCIAIILFFSIFTTAKSELTKYDYSKYNFKISFPEKPIFSIDSSETINFGSNNEYKINTYSWGLEVNETAHPNSYYSVSLTTYPPDFIHSDSLISTVEDFISSTQNSLAEDELYESIYSSSIEKNGFPGKEFKWKSKEADVFFEFTVFLIENKLFQLSIVSNESQDHNIFIKEFINSFELVNIKNGKYKLPALSAPRTFTINFPDKPTEETNSVDSELGKLIMDIQTLEPKSEDDNLVYIAIETKFPISFEVPKDVNELNKLYQKSIDGSLNSVSGVLVSIQDIQYKEYLGKEYRIATNEGKIILVYNIFYIGKNMYNFGVITEKAKDKNKKMIEFFKSFSIEK